MKALVGSWDTAPHKLLAEITALRSKVAQLRAENEDLRAENAMLRELRDAAAADELAGTSV
jgi:regulator of replication initiation timing